MASEIFVRLVAKDDASKAFNTFQRNAKASFAQAGRDMQSNIDKMAGSLNKLKTTASKAGADVGRGLSGAGRAASNMATSFGKALRSVTVFASATQVVRAFLNVVKDAVKTVANFETAATRLATIGASADEMARFRDVVLSMNPALGSSEDLMKGVFTAFTRGAESAEHALEITEVAAAGALGQFGKIQDAVSLLTQITNAYAGEQIDLTDAMDKLQAVAALGNAEFKDLIPSLGQALPIASALGISFDNAANSIAQIAKVTGNASRATTQYRAILTQIAQRANEFTKAGINVREVLSERNGLAKVMKLVANATQGSLFQLRKFFTNVRAANGASILTTQNLAKMEAAFEAVTKASGLTATNAKLVSNTMGGTLQATINAVRTSFIKLAGNDTEAVRQALTAIANVFITVGNNAATFQNFMAPVVIVVSALTAVVGGAVSILFLLGETVRAVIGKFQQWFGFLVQGAGFLTKYVLRQKEAGDAMLSFGKRMEEAGKEGQKFDGTMGQLAKQTLMGTIDTMDALGRTAGKFITNTGESTAQTELLTAANNEQIASWADSTSKIKEYLKAVDTTQQSQEQAKEKIKALNLSADDQAKAFALVDTAGRNLTLTFNNGLAPATTELGRIVKGVRVTQDGQVVTLNTLTNKADTTAESTKKLSASMDVLAGKGETINTAFATVFGKTLPDMQQELEDTLVAFNRLSKEGIVSTEALADKVEEAVKKAAEMFGTDSPITQKFQAQLDDLKSKADQGFKKVFGTWPGEAEKAGQEAVEALRNAAKAQGAVHEVMSQKLKEEIARQSALLGADSQVVKELEAMRDKMLAVGDAGFEKIFRKLPEAALRDTGKAIKALEDFVPKGKASLEAFAAGVKSSMDKAAAQFGEDAPYTTKLRKMLEKAEELLGQGRNSLKRILDQIGVDISLPVEGIDEKYREGFQAIVDSGKLTEIEMHEIFINQIRPHLLRTVDGVPAEWEKRFGEASNAAEKLRKRMVENQDKIGAKAKSTATGILSDYKSALAEMGVDTERFTGTWIEQSDARRAATKAEVNEAKGLFADFRGTMNTSLDFGQDPNSILGGAATELTRWENMTTQALREQLSNLQLSNDIRAKIMGILADRAQSSATSETNTGNAIRQQNAAALSGASAAASGGGGGASRVSSATPVGIGMSDAQREQIAADAERKRLLELQLGNLVQQNVQTESLAEGAERAQASTQKAIQQQRQAVEAAERELKLAIARGDSQDRIAGLTRNLKADQLKLEDLGKRLRTLERQQLDWQQQLNREKQIELDIAREIESLRQAAAPQSSNASGAEESAFQLAANLATAANEQLGLISSTGSYGQDLKRLEALEDKRLQSLNSQLAELAAQGGKLFDQSVMNDKLKAQGDEILDKQRQQVKQASERIEKAKRQGASQEVIKQLMIAQQKEQNKLHAVEQKIHDALTGKRNFQMEFNELRREELAIASQIEAIEAAREGRIIGSPLQSIALTPVRVQNETPGPTGQNRIPPLGGTVETSTGRIVDLGGNQPPSQETQDNTAAVEQNTAALQQVGIAASSGSRTPGRTGGSAQAPAFTPGSIVASEFLGHEASPTGIFGTGDRSDDDSIALGLGAFTRGSGRPFQGGGVVPQRGTFPLEQGERVIPRFNPLNSNQGGVTFGHRGATNISQGAGGGQAGNIGLSLALHQPRRHQPRVSSIDQAASQGRLDDVLGNTTQRTLAKAIIPAARVAIRRRDITRDLTSNTALTAQGTATIK